MSQIFVFKAVYVSMVVNQMSRSYICDIVFVYDNVLFFFVTKNMAKAVIKFIMEIHTVLLFEF